MSSVKKIRLIFLLVLLATASTALISPSTLQNWVYQAGAKPIIEYFFAQARETRRAQIGKALDERMTPNQLYQRVKSRYQLRPDMRFVDAAVNIHNFIKQSESASIELFHGTEDWQVSIAGIDAGVIPRYPSFRQGMIFLEGWATHLITENNYFVPAATSVDNRINAGADGYNPSALITNLKRLNPRWHSAERSGKELHAAVNNLVRLSLINHDTIGLGDDHNAGSLAMLALSRIINPSLDYNQQSSQLAYAMGYLGDAEALANLLDRNNLWRAYIEHDDRLLLRQLDKRGRVNEARYLMLRRLASKGDANKWLRFLNNYYGKQEIPVHALMTGYELGNARIFLNISRAIPLVVLELAGGEPTWRRFAADVLARIPSMNNNTAKTIKGLLDTMLRPGLGHNFDQFERLLETGKSNFVGPFISADSWVQWQRSLFIGAIYKHGVFTLDRMTNTRSTESLVTQLKSVEADEAKPLAAYFDFLLQARKNRVNINQGIDVVEAVKRYGGEPMFRVFEQIRDQFEFGSADLAVVMTRIVDATDSRMEGRFSYAHNTRRYLFDLGSAHRVYESIIRDKAVQSQNAKARMGYYYNDLEAIIDVLADPATSYQTADYIARKFESRGLSDAQLDRLYQLITEKFSWSWHLRQHYIDALELRQRYSDSRRQAQDWLESNADDAGSYDFWRAQVYIGRSYRLQGDYTRAEAAIQDTLRDDYGYGYYEATEIAIARGEFDKAIEIAEMIRTRYPHSDYSLQNSLRAYWAGGEYDKAAKLLGEARNFSFYHWRYNFGSIFSKIFADDVSAGIAAYKALTRTRIEPIRLAEVALTANRRGLHELAFESSNLLHEPGPGIFTYKLHAYRAMKNWRGEQAAVNWLNQLVPEQGRNRLSPIIYYQNQYDLLWDFISQPELDRHPYGVWTIRAAADALQGGLDRQIHERLQSYYGDPANDHYYDQLGRMAMNLDSGDRLLNSVFGAKGLAEVSYYKGVQEYSRGNYYAAADWYRTAIETRYQINAEYRWAYGQLESWARNGMALEHQIDSTG